jgi:transposase
MHAVTLEQLEAAGQSVALRAVQAFGLDCSSVALDMTNFATFIATANGKAPVAQRGKAKQKRSDLRLAGLGLVVTRDGGIPLTWHTYPGDKPDVTQFPDMITQLLTRYRAVCAAAGIDRRLRRRAELRGQLRAAGRHRPAVRGLDAGQRLP